MTCLSIPSKDDRLLAALINHQELRGSSICCIQRRRARAMYLDQQPYVHYPQPHRYDKRQAHHGHYPGQHPYASYDARGHVVMTQPRPGGRGMAGYGDEPLPDAMPAVLLGVVTCLLCCNICGLFAAFLARKFLSTKIFSGSSCYYTAMVVIARTCTCT